MQRKRTKQLHSMKFISGTFTIKKISALGALIFLILGGAVIGYGFKKTVAVSAGSQVLRENSPNYKLINPLLLVKPNEDREAPEYKILESLVTDYIRTRENSSEVHDISFYFRDLNSGKWTGVNDDIKYAPGSMLKVAVMLGYLKQAELNPAILEEKYYYNPQTDEGQYFKPPTMLANGTHTVTELIKNMIAESDNTATLTLLGKHEDAVLEVYKDLQLPVPQDNVDFMSVKNYSVLLRVLYNSTYLSRTLSEQSLTLMTLTTFNDGLSAGVPAGTVVAHKFGEHTNLVPGAEPVRELHDCGIVYPKIRGPYLLCIMTRGTSFDPLKKAISDLSKLVYDHLAADNL